MISFLMFGVKIIIFFATNEAKNVVNVPLKVHLIDLLLKLENEFSIGGVLFRFDRLKSGSENRMDRSCHGFPCQLAGLLV